MKIDQNKPHSIHLRLNDDQFEFCKNMAENADLGISDFVRVLINTTMVATKRVNKSFEEMNLGNAKLGEPHADDTSNK